MKPEILLNEDQIKTLVKDLAAQIERDYQGKDLVVLGVLKGAFIFMADLIREIRLPLKCEFIRISSYRQDGTQGHLRLDMDLIQPVRGEHVLVLEDIVDTGKTFDFISHHLKGQGATSVKFCALVQKQKSIAETKIDYLGQVIPDDYVVGYGMDLAGRLRNLPHIETGAFPEDFVT